MEYEAVIGLEVHAQIHTHSKMFCACHVVEDTGDIPPNTYVCPVCLALPGALPVVNRRAVEIGMLTGMALHCTINPTNVFARKSYFYPDLPKGYQISQYDLPLASDGYLDIEVDSETRRIRIRRAHLEEDTPSSITWTMAGAGGLQPRWRAAAGNRHGADLHTAEEVRAYATLLRTIRSTWASTPGTWKRG
jgi:aspartyl-tRNA(Asn)/glutamyl-tRNA(Gln) amidotransferase subunit B